MKVNHLELSRFKRFREFKLDFIIQSGIPNVILLIGDNGSGKTSILQSIAATLGAATKQINNPEELNWSGFTPNMLSASYRGFAEVKLEVEFTEDELTATNEFYKDSDYSTLPDPVAPEQKQLVKLIWNTSPSAKYPVATEPKGTKYFYQFQGRRYAYNLLYNLVSLNKHKSPEHIISPERIFKRIGGVFWYTEQRTSYSLAPFATEGGNQNSKPSIKQVDDEESMRRLLIRWFAFAKDEKNSKLEQFNGYYGRLFPGRKLSRIGDVYGTASAPIYFYDGSNEYDISELSGGERALLPLLLDFVEWGIHNSVILIDELELHLHPPLQQALLALLPELGSNNQFIITTHSDSIASLVPSESIKRIEE
jgi:predicted ATP-dependent endonuclease of OLD family